MRRALAIAICAVTACTPVPLGDGQRLTVVKALGSEVIGPALAEAMAAAGQLRQALAAFEGAPTPENLEGARGAWRKARGPWKAAASMPPDMVRPREVRELL